MQDIENIEKRICEIEEKRKQEDIKTCYSNLESLSNIINDLNKLSNSILKEIKEKLIERCNEEKKSNIKSIILLSYKSFMDKIYAEDSGNDYEQLLLDIQRSSFYPEYKNDIRIQLMELRMPRENIDFRDFIRKLKKLKKKFVDKYLDKGIDEDIKNCECQIANKELEDVKELLKNKEFGIVLNKMEKLLEEITNEENFQYIAEKYIKILENIIETKIEAGNKNIPELQIFKNFLKENEYQLDNYKDYKEKLKVLKKGKIRIKKEMDLMEVKEKKDISSIFTKNDKSYIKRDRKKVKYYLKEIEKYIPKKDLSEFRKCKIYIYKQIYNFEKEEKKNFVDTLKWIKDREKYKNELNNINNIGKIYSCFNYLNKKITHYDIYTIQLISLLILSKQKISNKMKGVFCKINTGEGKSTIIQFLAAYKVLCGNKVDIVTSSLVLAQRDATEIKKKNFYDYLEIKVGAVTDENAYSLDIIYGDTTHFSSDILLQDYEFIRKRGKRGYDVVIIDEVDSMCIDNLGTKTQLTKKFSGKQSLYTFYYVVIYVFNFIAFEMKLTNIKQDIEEKRDIIKKAVLQRLMGNSFILEDKDEDGVMREVDKYIIEEKKNNKGLNKSKSNESQSDEDEDEDEDEKLKKKVQKLITLDNDGKIKLFEVDGKNVVGILYPNCLKEEIEANLESWIDSVITSFSMAENIDYRIIEIKEKYKKIIPIDYTNTGESQMNMVWNEALHQILQIINDVEVFPENVNTNFLLIISFFRKYKELYGLTGTIGSEVNQETLQELYNVELYFIPPNKKSKLVKRSELVFTDEEKWQNKIIYEIKEILEENRSILLICSSIKIGENFENILKKNGIVNIKKYFIEDHKEVVEKEVLEQKHVIIATNLAGRGTDIKISKDLEEAGGLHVIVSFLPINQRVEDQNYGRAGRNGQNGSYSLIFKYNSENPIISVESIKKKREEDERRKVKDFRENELENMLKEEELFIDYCKFREEVLKKCINDFIKEDNEYHWGKILESKDCLEKKKEMLEDLKKRTLSVENIRNPLIKIKYFIQNIDKFDENDKKLFKEEKFYSWPLKMEYATYLAKEKGREDEKFIQTSIKYYKEVIENLKDFQIDIQNQTILFLFIFKSLTKNKNLNEKEKPKIESQNERKKKILQAIIDIVKKNIETLKKFQNEKSETSYIEHSEYLDIPIICKNNLSLDIEKNNDEIDDLKYFIKEFGIEKIEIIKIVNKPNFWKNYIVLSVGVIEVTVGAIILIKTKGSDPFSRKVAFFLIKEGFKDIIFSFQKAMEGKDINLKEWGLTKAADYAKGILTIAVGDCVGIGNTLSLKNEIITMTTKYAAQKSVEYFQYQLTKNGGSKIQSLCTKYITKPLIEKIHSKSFSDNKYFVMDLVNDDKYYEDYIVKKTFTTFNYISKSKLILKPIFDQIRIMIKERSITSIGLGLLKLIPTFKESFLLINNIVDNLNVEKDLSKSRKGFDGSLKTLLQINFETYEQDTEIKINELSKQLIKYNVINQDGKFDINQIDNKNLQQGYFLQINQEFKEIKSSKNNYLESSEKILGLDYKKKNEYINYINEVSYYFDIRQIDKKKKEILERITKNGAKFSKPIVDLIIDCLLNKFTDFIQKKDEEEKKEEKEEKEKEEKEKKQKRNSKKIKPNKEIEEKPNNIKKKIEEEPKNIKKKIEEKPNNIKKKIEEKPNNIKNDNPKKIDSFNHTNPNNSRINENEISQSSHRIKNSTNSPNNNINTIQNANAQSKSNCLISNSNSYYIGICSNYSRKEDRDSVETKAEEVEKQYQKNKYKFGKVNISTCNPNDRSHSLDYSDIDSEELRDAAITYLKEPDKDYKNGNHTSNCNINGSCPLGFIDNNIMNEKLNANKSKKKDSPIKSLIGSTNKIDFNTSNGASKNPYSLLFGNKNDFNNTNKLFEKEIPNNILPNINIPKYNPPFITSEINYDKINHTFSKVSTQKNNNEPKNRIPSSRNTYGPKNMVSFNNKENDKSKIESIVSKTIGGVAFAGNFLNPLSYMNKSKNTTSNLSGINKIESGQKSNAFDVRNAFGPLMKKLAPKNKNNKFDYYKDKIQKGLTNKTFLTALSTGLDIYNSYQEIKEAFKKPKNYYEEDLKNLDKKNINQLSQLEKDELEEKENKKAEEEEQEKKLLKKGEEEWNRYKIILIESILREINYMYLIEEFFENYFLDFKSDINEKMSKIFNNDFKAKFALAIQEKHHSFFLSIKNTIPQIETLNLIITGYSGTGKSSLTNALLQFNEAEEGSGIKSVSQTFKKYSNPKIPGITIYDTVGIEPTNKERNIDKLKQKIQETLNANLEDSKNSIHSIIYCINNGSSSNRIEKSQAKLIRELDRSYGNNDILTVVLTQSINNSTEKRKNQFKKDLCNDNIEIIDILAKDYDLEIGNINYKIKAFGLDKLIESIKKNAKKVVTANLKQIAKNKIKKEFIENTNKKYNEMQKKIRNHELESTFTKECELILKVLFGDINLNFNDIEKVISKYIEKLNIKIIDEIKNKNKEKSLDKINEQFIIFNAKYDNLLKQNTNVYEEYIINEKFEDYFKPKINDEVNKIVLEKASLIFMENVRKYLNETISENVKDEEIEDLAASNVEKILKKINI